MRNYDAYENYVINSKRDFETTERGRRRQQDKTEREYRDLSRSPPKSTEFRDGMERLII